MLEALEHNPSQHNYMAWQDRHSRLHKRIDQAIAGLPLTQQQLFKIISTGVAWFGQSATAPATGNNGTIATTTSVSRVSPAAAVTGVILQAGTHPGQVCFVINEANAANTITFAAAGTSNVADGVSAVIAGLRQMQFTWDASTNLWYH
jgi:hypothetical protein